MRPLALLLLSLAMLDAALLLQPSPAATTRVEPASATLPAAPGPIKPPGVRADWLATTLARPLFAAGRRPPHAQPEPAAEQPNSPRLTGIIVAALTRRAVFALPGAVSSVVVAEGDRVEPFEVTSIGATAVELNGPGGRRTLYPTGDARLRAASAAGQPPSPLIAPWRRELETETDQ